MVQWSMDRIRRDWTRIARAGIENLWLADSNFGALKQDGPEPPGPPASEVSSKTAIGSPSTRCNPGPPGLGLEQPPPSPPWNELPAA